jgi:hypothetical protein
MKACAHALVAGEHCCVVYNQITCVLFVVSTVLSPPASAFAYYVVDRTYALLDLSALTRQCRLGPTGCLTSPIAPAGPPSPLLLLLRMWLTAHGTNASAGSTPAAPEDKQPGPRSRDDRSRGERRPGLGAVVGSGVERRVRLGDKERARGADQQVPGAVRPGVQALLRRGPRRRGGPSSVGAQGAPPEQQQGDSAQCPHDRAGPLRRRANVGRDKHSGTGLIRNKQVAHALRVQAVQALVEVKRAADESHEGRREAEVRVAASGERHAAAEEGEVGAQEEDAYRPVGRWHAVGQRQAPGWERHTCVCTVRSLANACRVRPRGGQLRNYIQL